MAHTGDDTPFGFRIPANWPRWKVKCGAPSRSRPGGTCQSWAVRGMPTCKIHGSGGARNAKLGLIRYLSWIIIGMPQDTPVEYARFVAMSAALEMMFNKGYGTPEQRLKAAMWMSEIGELEPFASKAVHKVSDMSTMAESEQRIPYTGA
jgi:hypothetical protein